MILEILQCVGKFIIYTVITLLCVMILAITAGVGIMHHEYRNQIAAVTTQEDHENEDLASYNEADLPLPVQKYFRYALAENSIPLRYLYWRFTGEIAQMNKDRLERVSGEGYINKALTRMIWRSDSLFFTLRETFINREGRTSVNFGSLFKIVDRIGEDADRDALMHLVVLSVLAPDNLLPDEHKRWHAVDDLTAEFTMEYKHLFIACIFHFDRSGRIVKSEYTRIMNNNFENWSVFYSDYRETADRMIPGKIAFYYSPTEEERYNYATIAVTSTAFEQ